MGCYLSDTDLTHSHHLCKNCYHKFKSGGDPVCAVCVISYPTENRKEIMQCNWREINGTIPAV